MAPNQTVMMERKYKSYTSDFIVCHFFKLYPNLAMSAKRLFDVNTDNYIFLLRGIAVHLSKKRLTSRRNGGVARM